MVSTSVQRSNAHVLRELVGERSRRNGFPSSERVRLLQPLLLHPQEGWWSKTHSRFQTSESRPYETAVQDDYIEADHLANMPRGLVLFARSERPFHIQINPHHRRFLRFTFECLAYQYTVLFVPHEANFVKTFSSKNQTTY